MNSVAVYIITYFFFQNNKKWWYSKICVKQPLSNRQKIGFQDQLSLNAGQKYCWMLQGEHSAILSIFIKLPFVIKIFVLSIFEWLFYTGLTVLYFNIKTFLSTYRAHWKWLNETISHRGQKFHSSARIDEWILKRTSDSSQSARPTGRVLKSEG